MRGGPIHHVSPWVRAEEPQRSPFKSYPTSIVTLSDPLSDEIVIQINASSISEVRSVWVVALWFGGSSPSGS
mgnify:CR=1 FL=1